MRQKFSVGQEVTSSDLNDLQSRLERGIIDRFIYELIGKKTNGFFAGGFQTLYQTAISVTIKAGLGLMNADTGSKDPARKPVVLDTDITQNISTPDPSNPRIDIICVKYNRFNTEAEDRNFKDEFTDTITVQSTTVATDWKADVLYVEGEAGVSPVVPTTPTGYVKICEMLIAASTGIAGQASITDSRTIFPIASSVSDTGTAEYDAIVGVIGVDQGANYSTLKSAIDNSQDGWKILVLNDQTANAITTIATHNIEIIFKRGAKVNRGTAASAIEITGDDCKLVNAKFADFDTPGDIALKIASTASRTVLNVTRFDNCDTTIQDNGIETYIDTTFEE